MQIVCPNCQAEYELDPPAPPFARDQDLVFRCTACGTAIPLRLNEPEIPDELEEEPDTDVVEAPPRVESFILLKQSDSTYRVENTAQQWIAERRIADDEVAIDGEIGGESETSMRTRSLLAGRGGRALVERRDGDGAGVGGDHEGIGDTAGED